MAAPADPGAGSVDRDPAYGWVIVAALATTQTVSWGVLYYAFPVLMVPMAEALGLSTLVLAGAFSLALAVSGVAGLGVGRWLDRRSPRTLMTAGSAIAGLLVVAWSQATSVVALYLVFAGIGAAMATLLYEPGFIVVTKWFSRRRREALTVVTLVAASSSLLFSPLSERLATAFGWRAALLVLAGILVVVTVPLHGLVLRPSPRSEDPAPAEPAEPRHPRRRLPGFVALTASFALGAFATSAIGVHLVALLVGAGHSAAAAAGVAGLVGISQVPGRLLFAPIGRRLGDRRLAGGVFGTASLAFAILAVDRSSVGVIGFAVLFGGSAGMTSLLRPAVIGDLYGTGSFGRVSSVAAAWVTAVRAIAPFAAAALALLPGGYVTLSWILAGVSAVAGTLAARAVEAAGAASDGAMTETGDLAPA